jgi:hypothetical protein
LKKLPTELYESFGNTIERIARQPEDLASQAIKILMWIHLAERPLSVDELLHALATEPGHHDLDHDNFPSRSTFLNCCLGLAITDDETLTVRLVHYSLEEYLKTQAQLFPRGHEMIAEVCLTYLMFESCTSELVSGTSWDEIKLRIQEMPGPPELALLAYASCEWGHHARKGHPLEEPAASMTLKYLSESWKKRQISISYLYLQIRKTENIRVSKEFLLSFSSLHIAAFFGIHQVLLDTPLADLGLDGKDNYYGRTPLSWAAKNGHEAVVKLLLEEAVDVDSKDGDGQTPLSWAAGNGYEAVVKLLLEKAADVDSKDTRYGQTPLSWAAENGHEAVVKLLLEKAVDVDSKDRYGRTPLAWAAGNGHGAVVGLLESETQRS